ncbi:class I SAM-dependent methyltransferase [Luteipulveratus sp. YIM 133132]|uniref:class I SAM-dependent methyltransferase n=1 Tax=Luteipulveratus flavus TaxID=3031728 RepID=UPI0023B0DBFF|nr:class I SAM-dependent methyltransferase [Luteipulveratus sp. YIM 133132]MDE9364606.1 class I SAM-dependent methyltransferase [Luteipulveratus sp. YIM 133132]
MASPVGPDFYDVELRALHEHLRAAYGIEPGDAVLDVGCGAGLTTREAARAAAPGSVTGVDTSAEMLGRARRLAVEEGLSTVRFVPGDAQTYAFEPASFDVAVSRFGTMFFDDPPVAFANIAAALRPGGRLVMLVWQPGEDNEWSRAIDTALGRTAFPPSRGMDPFSLGDRDATTRLMEGAGFGHAHFEDVREPVFYGRTVQDALDVVLGFRSVSEALDALGSDAGGAIDRIREALAAHHSAEHGVRFAAGAWLITARRSR